MCKSLILPILIIAVIVGLVAVAALDSMNSAVPQNLACTTDSDCIGSTCCHPTSCTNSAYRGPCNMLCTDICEGPIDCGAGHCGCVDGKCSVITGPG